MLIMLCAQGDQLFLLGSVGSGEGADQFLELRGFQDGFCSSLLGFNTSVGTFYIWAMKNGETSFTIYAHFIFISNFHFSVTFICMHTHKLDAG